MTHGRSDATQTLFERAKPLLSHVFLRAILALVVTTGSILGGTYFIIDISQRGIEKSIDTVNTRISGIESRIEFVNKDISDRIIQAKSDITNILDLKFNNIKLEMSKEFNETKREIRKASIEIDLRSPAEIADLGIRTIYKSMVFRGLTLEIPTDPTAKKIADAIREAKNDIIFSRYDEGAPFAVIGRVPPSSELSRAVSIIYAISSERKTETENTATLADLASYRGKSSNECFTMNYINNKIEINLKNTARLGRDGFVCVTGEYAFQK